MFQIYVCREIEDQRQRRLTQRLQQLAAEQRRADELKRKEEEAAAAAAAGQSVEGAVGDKRKYENGLDDSRRGLRQRLGEIDEVKMLRRRQVWDAFVLEAVRTFIYSFVPGPGRDQWRPRGCRWR